MLLAALQVQGAIHRLDRDINILRNLPSVDQEDLLPRLLRECEDMDDMEDTPHLIDLALHW